MTSRGKQVALAAVAVLLFGVAAWLIFFRGGGSPPPPEAAGLELRTEQVLETDAAQEAMEAAREAPPIERGSGRLPDSAG